MPKRFGSAEIEDRSAYITSQIGILLLFAHLIPMCFSAEQVNGNYGYWWFLSLTYHIHSYCGGFISMYVPHFHWDILGQVITSVLTNCESFSCKMWVMGRSKQLLQLLDEQARHGRRPCYPVLSPAEPLTEILPLKWHICWSFLSCSKGGQLTSSAAEAS